MSSWGQQIKLSVFGESHGPAIGVVLDGLPAGERISREELSAQMLRRAPGRDKTATPRSEKDEPRILSGMLGDKTTGTPLCAVIENTNTRSGDYGNLLTVPRPGHGDFTGFVRYGGHNDIRGGGHFSGRLTAPLVFAGAVCRQILAARGICIGAHIASVGPVQDSRFVPEEIPEELLRRLSQSSFALIDPAVEAPMRSLIEECRLSQDSVGGVVECAVTGMPAGVGSPMFDGVENRLASLLFGIPAVKGVEFGEGFGAAAMRGSEHNDAFCMKEGKVATVTNRHGGILGGITSGMPIVFRVAVKPTPSISRPQQSVDLTTGEETTLSIHGRHDPCIVPRAVPVVEACAAIALLDLLLSSGQPLPRTYPE